MIHKKYFCTSCQSERVAAKSSFNIVIFIILLCFFVFPAVLYLLFSTKSDKCGNCGSKTLVPLSSPSAQAYLASKRNVLEAKQDHKTCPFCAELIKKNAILCKYCGSSMEHDVVINVEAPVSKLPSSTSVDSHVVIVKPRNAIAEFSQIRKK